MFSPWGRPSLPRQCRCGHTDAAQCPEIGLNNHRNFPPFAHLPDFDDIDDDYYHIIDGRLSYSPSRHWVLVGEIIENQSDVIRPRALLETKYGERVLVNFHLEDSPTPAFFKWSDIVARRTMCIFYAKNKTFMDMQRGVRQEYSKTAMVLPASLPQLTKECESLHHAEKERNPMCFLCGEQSTIEKLKRCSRCKLSLYCSKECQMAHWKDAHKKLCRHMPMLNKLVALDFTRFDAFIYWDFVSEALPTQAESQEHYRQAKNDFLRSRGVEPLSKQERLSELLRMAGNKVLESDPISDRIQGLLCRGVLYEEMISKQPDFLKGLLSAQPYFQGLQTLAEKYKNESLRYHVIDSDSKRGTAADTRFDRTTDETLQDMLMSVLFFSMPQWQVEFGITGLVWVVEIHHYFPHPDLFPADVWDLQANDCDGFAALSRRNNDRAFFHDELQVLSSLADQLAVSFPSHLVVRIFRPTEVMVRRDGVREIAAQETRENVLTLWIREHHSMSGARFRPLNPQLSLADQLTDCEQSNNIESLLMGDLTVGRSETEIE